MKKIKLTIVTTLLILMGLVAKSQTNDQQHDAIVIGVISHGNQEIASVEDRETGIIYKSEPMRKGDLITGEPLIILCDGDLKRVEVLKDGLNKKTFCFNRDWSKGMNLAAYIESTDEVFVGKQVSVNETSNGVDVVFEGEIKFLSSKAKSLVDHWGQGNGNDPLERYKVKGDYDGFNRVGDFTVIHCVGDSGNCFRQARRSNDF